VVTVPSQVARLFEKMGRFKSLRPPVKIAPADVRVHWHERFERDAANRWLRELVVELYAEPRPALAGAEEFAGITSGPADLSTRPKYLRARRRQR